MLTPPHQWPADVEARMLRLARRALTQTDLEAICDIAERAYAETVPLSVRDFNARNRVGASVCGAHLAWLKCGANVVQIDVGALRQLVAQGERAECPEPPIGAGVVRFGTPLEFAPDRPSATILRFSGWYWEGSRWGDGWKWAIVPLTLVAPEIGTYTNTISFESWSWQDAPLAFVAGGHPRMIGLIWRVMAAVWSAPVERLIHVAAPTRKPSKPRPAWTGAYRRLELAPLADAPPVQRRMERVQPAQATQSPAAPSPLAGVPLTRLVCVPAHERVVWVLEQNADTEEGCAALDAIPPRIRRTSDGRLLLGVRRPVAAHTKGPDAPLAPVPKVTRIVGAGEVL